MTGPLQASLSFTFGDGKLKPILKANDPHLHMSLSFWCALALAAVSGPVGFAVIDAVTKIASSIAGCLINDALSSGIPVSTSGTSSARS
jgi:hypothetical protein